MEFLKLRTFPVDNVQEHITYGIELSLTESVGIFKTGLPHLKGQGHIACRIALFTLCPLPVGLRIQHIRYHRIFQEAQGTAYSRRREVIVLAVIDPVIVLEKDYAFHEIVAGRVPDIDGVRPGNDQGICRESIGEEVGIQRVLTVVKVHPPVLGHGIFAAFHHQRPEGAQGILGNSIYEEGLHYEAGISLAHVVGDADRAPCLEIVTLHIGALVYHIHDIPDR